MTSQPKMAPEAPANGAPVQPSVAPAAPTPVSVPAEPTPEPKKV